MICPKCNSNLEGDLIYDTFFERYNNEDKALEVAAMYGATKTTGWWDRAISIYSQERDRTVAYRCPDCGHEWERKWD